MTTAFIGKAKIFIAPYASGASFDARAFVYAQNTSAFQFGFSEEEKKLLDYASPSGGIDVSVKRISDATGSMDLRHFTPENLAMALWGTTAALGVTPIVGEAGKFIVPNKFVPTARLIDTTVAPVVKSGATTISTSDYTVSPAGILIAATISTGGVSSGDPLTIDYTPQASDDIKALMTSAPDVSVIIEGINEVDGKYTVGRFWKVKLGAAQNVAMIGDDFGTLAVSFSIQKDETVAGGKSMYFELEAAQ